MKKVVVFSLIILLAQSIYAQKGHLRGKVIDGENGEALIGATISKEGTSIGAVADFDGNYSVALEPGFHTILFQFVSYATIKVENVEIKAGEVTSMDMTLSPDVQTLEAVVVEAQVMRDTETALLTLQKKSPNLVDGVSAQTFKKTGDSNLATAIKRVTGVSIQGGKYVFVRGLGDRYSKTTLNGMSIPGLDPDRNDVQIDIFPTSVLENVVIYKTFSPDLQGDFTGGTVNVETKNFPEEKRTTVSVGMGYNPRNHLKKDFVTNDGGGLDFLGFDDGSRDLPFSGMDEIPSVSRNPPSPIIEDYTRRLNPELAVKNERNFMNYSLSFDHGNQIDKGRAKIGYNAILSYQKQSQYNESIGIGEYTIPDNPAETDLFVERFRRGPLSQENVLWSGLLSGAVKFDNHTFSASLFHTQNGLDQVTVQEYRDFEESGARGQKEVLAYSQRSVTSGMLSGQHKINDLRVEWSNALTFAGIYDPDFRDSRVAILENGLYSLSRGAGGGIDRFWRELNEVNENLRVDLSYPIGENHTIKGGAMTLLKWRTFDVFNYNIRVTDNSSVSLDTDLLLQPDAIWTPATEDGTYIAGDPQPANIYEARSSVNSFYGMGDSRFGALRLIYGVRAELATMNYTGQDFFGRVVYDDEQTLDEINILPSANVVYGLTDQMNIRASYGRTLARPSFREKSISALSDPIGDRTYIGNINLEQTVIDNYDLRWEYFFGLGEMISVSGFYKSFTGHIEQVAFQVNASDLTWRNIDDSKVYGLEFEFRKNLSFINANLEGLSFGSNVSIQESEVDSRNIIVNFGVSDGPEDDITEYQSKLDNAREGETVDPIRGMAGQAPYLINGYLNYTDLNRKYNLNVSYNVQGETLFIVGNSQNPSVYTQPFHSLNLNASVNFGQENNQKLALKVTNILDDNRLDQYVGFGDARATWNEFNPGTTFNLKYSYTF